MDNPDVKGDYRVGYVKEPRAPEQPVKYKPVQSPPCPHVVGRKHLPCDGKGDLLVIPTGTTLPNAVVAEHVFDPSTGRVTDSGKLVPVPKIEPFEPLADRWFWYRCSECGHRFSVRGTPVQPKAKAAK